MELSNKTIKDIARFISDVVRDYGSMFINIQIEEEFSQYDILFSHNYYNYGYHQRGIRNGDLLISIVGFGSHGFRLEHNVKTDKGYYEQKLDISSPLLTELFNLVRVFLYYE